jgi:hypothetical protein
LGPRPADEALRKLDSVLPANPPPWALLSRAQLLAMLGRFEEAWALALPASERARELRGSARGDHPLAGRYQRKQNLAKVAQVRPRLDALRAKVPADA